MADVNNILIIVSLFCIFPAVSGLSCYVCDKEEWNWGTCTIKVQECGMFQDACTSYVAFHIPLVFHARGERIHQISKGCDTQLGCETRQAGLDQQTCSRTPYADWSCVECCRGDLCIYYVTLGSGTAQVSLLMMMLLVCLHRLAMWI